MPASAYFPHSYIIALAGEKKPCGHYTADFLNSL